MLFWWVSIRSARQFNGSSYGFPKTPYYTHIITMSWLDCNRSTSISWNNQLQLAWSIVFLKDLKPVSCVQQKSVTGGGLRNWSKSCVRILVRLCSRFRKCIGFKTRVYRWCDMLLVSIVLILNASKNGLGLGRPRTLHPHRSSRRTWLTQSIEEDCCLPPHGHTRMILFINFTNNLHEYSNSVYVGPCKEAPTSWGTFSAALLITTLLT